MRRPPLDDEVHVPPARKPKARFCGGRPPRLHMYKWEPATGPYLRDVYEERCETCQRKDRTCFGPSRWFPWHRPCICGKHKERQ